jgi:hypothetical protein
MEQGTLTPQASAQTQTPPPQAAAAQAAAPGQAQPLEADVQAHLGRQLRAVYDEMASQPVPDRFIQLLDALERRQRPAASLESATTPDAAKVKAGDA